MIFLLIVAIILLCLIFAIFPMAKTICGILLILLVLWIGLKTLKRLYEAIRDYGFWTVIRILLVGSVIVIVTLAVLALTLYAFLSLPHILLG